MGASSGVGAVVLVVTLAGCGLPGDGTADEPPVPPPTTSTATGPSSSSEPTRAEPIDLGSGAVLRPGPDGTLPVSVRWNAYLAAPEAFSVVGDRLYAADECLDAYDLDSGDRLWFACKPDENGLFTDGGVELGPAGPGRLRYFAPYNETVVVDTVEGTVVERRGIGGRRPPGFRAYPTTLFDDYRVTAVAGRPVVARHDGRVLWRITFSEPLWYDHLPAQETPHGFAMVLGTGTLLVLDLE
jgi:hypothetical protein